MILVRSSALTALATALLLTACSDASQSATDTSPDAVDAADSVADSTAPDTTTTTDVTTSDTTLLPPTLPDTPAGQQLAWFASFAETGVAPKEATLRAHYAANRLIDGGLDAVTTQVDAIRALWPLELDAIEVDEPCHLQVVFRDEEDVAWRFDVWVEHTDAGLIKILEAQEARDLNPKATDLGPDEMAILIVNPATGQLVTVATVQVLDAVSGQPFGHAVTEHNRGVWRLRLPTEAGPAAVKITFSNGDTTLNHLSARSPAEGVRVLYAYTKSAAAYYLGLLDLMANPDKGHLWVLTEYLDDREAAPVLGNVGCATVSSDPDVTFHYTNPSNGLVDLSATATNPRIPSAYAFNVAQGAHTVSASIDGHDVSVTIPAIEPGVFHVVHLAYLASEVGPNPAVAGCYVDAGFACVADESALSGVAGTTSVTRVGNRGETLADIYRITATSTRVFLGSLKPGSEAFLLSAPGQPFIMADDAGDCGAMVVTPETGVGSGDYAPAADCLPQWE